MAPTIRVAACHIAPVYLNAKATTEKVVQWIRRAASNNAHLVTFPESTIPAFPWSTLIPPSENHEFFVRMAHQSIFADGDEIAAIRQAARECRIFVSVGFTEKARFSSATLWNANMIISSGGEVLVHHRKLMPTAYEKLTWTPGDGHGLKVVDIPVGEDSGKKLTGKLGMLICGENTNPLARYAMIAQGEQIHITTWPAKAPHRNLDKDSNAGHSASGRPPRGSYDNRAVNRMRCGEHCFEAKCFGVLCSSVMTEEIIDILVSGLADPVKSSVRSTYELATQAETLFLSPSGAPLPSFTIDEAGRQQACESLCDEEGILYADMDMEDTIEGKQYHDVVGAYQRLDVFQLTVDTTRRSPCTFV